MYGNNTEHMKQLLRICFVAAAAALSVCLLCACSHSESMSPDTAERLTTLDSMLASREVFAAGRETRIRTSTKDLRSVVSDSDAYNIGRSLFSAYRNYRVDSALWIAGQRLALAKRMSDSARIYSASLNLAECLSAAANYPETLDIIDKLDRHQLKSFQLQYLYKIYCDTYLRMSLSDGLETNRIRYRRLYRQYLDSALAATLPESHEHYLLKARQFLDAGYPENALKEIKTALDHNPESAADPKIMYVLGLAYHALGNDNAEMEALANSAIMYIRSGQRDYPSLMKLAAAANSNGDHDRAYRYIMAALEDAHFCNSRSRTSEILELVPLISSAHSAMEKQNLHRAWSLAAIIVAMAVANGISFVWAYRQLRKKQKISLRLQEANEHLRNVNNALEIANRDKISFINRLFSIYSDYIDRIDAYRRRIIKLLKMSQARSALDYLESNKIVSDELKDMYRSFDAMFIELYPDFIGTYNRLVHDNERLEPDSRQLPAKVRVLALMKIGISEPMDMARLLHYTPQTVYNYCSQLRAAAKVPYSEFESIMLSTQ